MPMTREERRAEIETLEAWFEQQHREFEGEPFPPEVRESWNDNKRRLEDLRMEENDIAERLNWLKQLAGREGNLERGSAYPQDRSRRTLELPGEDGSGRAPFVFSNTLQRAALRSNERFEDHPSVREHRAARAQAEKRITESYGSVRDYVRTLPITQVDSLQSFKERA